MHCLQFGFKGIRFPFLPSSRSLNSANIQETSGADTAAERNAVTLLLELEWFHFDLDGEI